jgi:cephalosporin hydroxylase
MGGCMAVQFLDRSIKLPTSSAEVRSRFENDQWLMTDAERSALYALLSELRPACAIEIGTYKAGSLTTISKFCKHVYTLDIDPSFRDTYEDRFPDVQFIVGDSAETLPPLLKEIQRLDEPLGFILIDADHTENGMRRDIENILRYIPTRPLYIIMHDSFNPDCRRGMLKANWSSNPHTHLVELDYIAGRFISNEKGDRHRQMWCGFALAILLPEPRDGKILIHQNEGFLFQKTYWHSIHSYRKVRNLVSIRKLKSKGRKFIKRLFCVL